MKQMIAESSDPLAIEAIKKFITEPKKTKEFGRTLVSTLSSDRDYFPS